MKLLFLVISLGVACTVPRSQLTVFSGQEEPDVAVGRYPGHLEMLSDEHPVAKRALAWRRDAEGNEPALRALVRDRLDTEKMPLEFRHMYTGLDSAAGAAALRYFAFHPEPREIAGWEVFLVYELRSGRLVRAFVSALPLE